MMHLLRNKRLDYHYFNIYVAWARGNAAGAELPDAVHGDRGTAAAVDSRAPGQLRCALLYSDQKPASPKELGVKTD